MSDSLLASYEELPYESLPFSPTHPDNLATIAILFGIEPPPVEACCVLELGCAGGGNLIPMALTMPGSRFVGIDLSPRQIADGQAVVQALGLSNIELRPLSLMDLAPDLGRFDYVICHGVYSWVPPAVQDRILAICREHLAPNGVAYVSYNTYPGWHVRGMIRDMLSFHVQPLTDPQARVREGRKFLEFLTSSVADPKSLFAYLLKEEALLLGQQTDSYVFHEHLEEVNYPVYFHQFAAQAASHGLQYLGEAKFSDLANRLPPEVRDAIHRMTDDPIRLEQYFDFLRDRTFRRTLLCHAEVSLNRSINPERVSRFLVTTNARPVSQEPDIRSTAVESFRTLEGATASTNNPHLKAALVSLIKVWPAPLSFPELLEQTRKLLEGASVEGCDSTGLSALLLQCFMSDLVELNLRKPAFILNPGERPCACPLARLQAGMTNRVTNLRHRSVVLNELDRLVLRLSDGTQDRAAILASVSGAIDADSPLSMNDLVGSLRRLAVSSLLMA